MISLFGIYIMDIGAQSTSEGESMVQLVPLDSSSTKNNTVTAFAYVINNKHFVFSGGDGGFIDVFEADEGGNLVSIGSYTMYNQEGPARGLYADEVGGKHFLFVGNKGGNAVEVFQINDNGGMERVFLLKDTEDTYLGVVITLRVIHINNKHFLFVGGLEDKPGLSSFRIHSDGKLTHIHSVRDDDLIHTDGIIGMYDHQINGKTYLVTGGFQDNGVSSFRVYDNGTFENVSNIADNTKDRYLTGAYPVDGVTLGDNHYVIVGHRHHKYYKRIEFIKKKDFVYHGDGLSVFKMDEKGQLIPHYVLKNEENLKLGGQTRIEILKLDDNNAIVLVGTRDDNSIQICRLDKKGILTPESYLSVGYPIYYGLASLKINSSYLVFGGSVDNNVKKLFSYNYIAPPQKVLNHIVGFKFKEGITDTEITQATELFLGLPERISEILTLKSGENRSKQGFSKGVTHCFNLTFVDEKARDNYLEHAAHHEMVDKVRPLLDDIVVLEFWIEK